MKKIVILGPKTDDKIEVSVFKVAVNFIYLLSGVGFEVYEYIET